MHTDALYALRESGQIVEFGRGLYRLAHVNEAEYPDLAVVAARAPNAVVSLISALSYRDITTQIPSSVHLAVPRNSYYRIKLSIPVTVYRFDPKTFHEGLETHHVADIPLKIYAALTTMSIDWHSYSRHWFAMSSCCALAWAGSSATLRTSVWLQLHARKSGS